MFGYEVIYAFVSVWYEIKNLKAPSFIEAFIVGCCFGVVALILT